MTVNDFLVMNRILSEAKSVGKKVRHNGAPVFTNFDSTNNFKKNDVKILLKLLSEQKINRVFLANSDENLLDNVNILINNGWKLKRGKSLKIGEGKEVFALEMVKSIVR